MSIESVNILGVNVSKVNYDSFIEFIAKSIQQKSKPVIGYANADTLNKSYTDNKLRNIYNTFQLVHPDGIGVYLASKFLYGKNGLPERITGSDFYQFLINESIKKNWTYFFFGHDNEILESIKSGLPEIKIAGYNEGYHFETSDVIRKINSVNPDIIIIGLSCPLQENWMYDNKDKINFGVMLAVGDGIRVFAGKKYRGPEFIQKLGLEWMVRLIQNPARGFGKYVIGIPLFIFRICKAKLK